MPSWNMRVVEQVFGAFGSVGVMRVCQARPILMQLPLTVQLTVDSTVPCTEGKCVSGLSNDSV
jgi:hypothetical protein